MPIVHKMIIGHSQRDTYYIDRTSSNREIENSGFAPVSGFTPVSPKYIYLYFVYIKSLDLQRI